MLKFNSRSQITLLAVASLVVLVSLVGRWGQTNAASGPPTAPPPFPVLPPQFEMQRTASLERVRPGAVEMVGPLYGIDFISSAEAQADPQQFANAHATGATWDRWPLYWTGVELSPGSYSWTNVDATVSAEIDQGFDINLIFLGVPGFYWSNGRAVPDLLYETVFTDGTDIDGPGKQINPNNKWAAFIAAAVNRYRPGGVLARAENWPEGVGVTHWEMWNEPDLPFFWSGTKAEFARLLKVGYLATKHTDSNAQVLFGAVANSFEPGFFEYYDNVLDILDSDPQAVATGYFHDIFATHSYFYAWQTYFHIDRARQTMLAHGIDHPIWLNESGVPAWNDYPGPVWDGTSAFRATKEEQADYTIQSAFYAIMGGAEAIFHFQLMDGCGNQPAGTDFPPHNGELCDANGNLISDPSKPCAGDAFGLFSNATDAACFRQHPQPETARLNFGAFQVLTTHVTDVEPLWYQPGGGVEQIALYRPNSGERLLVVWARTNADETVTIAALDSSATLIAPDGSTQTATPNGGQYVLNLSGATNQNYPFGGGVYAIGGEPIIVMESDRQAPAATLSATVISTPTVQLAWTGDDGLGGGLDNFTLSVAIDGAAAQPWLSDTSQTTAVYPGAEGHVYTFYLTAKDRAGNVGAAEPVTVDFSGINAVKLVDKTTADPGDVITYTITVGNTGDMTPTLTISDVLPAHTSYISDTLTASFGTAAYADGVITWQAVMPPNTTATLTFAVQIDPLLDDTNATIIKNRAWLTDGDVFERWLSADTVVGEVRVYLPNIHHR
ncbi:MAG: hypothetical protein M9930_17220 [Anaerolineae bacterium]|nr:hypothetical protein [Anaerolineae bacterium]